MMVMVTRPVRTREELEDTEDWYRRRGMEPEVKEVQYKHKGKIKTGFVLWRKLTAKEEKEVQDGVSHVVRGQFRTKPLGYVHSAGMGRSVING